MPPHDEWEHYNAEMKVISDLIKEYFCCDETLNHALQKSNQFKLNFLPLLYIAK